MENKGAILFSIGGSKVILGQQRSVCESILNKMIPKVKLNYTWYVKVCLMEYKNHIVLDGGSKVT